MKLSVAFALLFVTVLAAAVNGHSLNVTCVTPSTNYGQSHNVTWGKPSPNQLILRQELVSQDFSFLRVVSGDYFFNQTCVQHPRNITQIKVTDLYTNGDGGYATLLSGGPRYTFAKIHFKSQRDHGFKFLVTIFY